MAATEKGRIGEADIAQDVIAIIESQPDRQISTTQLIEELRRRVPLGEGDQAILANRNDDRFSQIVRNIKSHRKSKGNLIAEGQLVPIRGGFKRP